MSIETYDPKTGLPLTAGVQPKLAMVRADSITRNANGTWTIKGLRVAENVLLEGAWASEAIG